jgi:hypothetical protein
MAMVASRHKVNASQVFHWPQAVSGRILSTHSETIGELRLLPVTVVSEEQETKYVATSTGAVHIAIPGKALISIEGCAGTAAVCAALECLR